MMGKTLLIRADASAEMGIGHVMRCLALSQAWQNDCGEVLFALATGSEQVERRILSAGARVTRISAPAASPDDALQTRELAVRSDAEWLVLDGYHFSEDYLKSMESAPPYLLFMDDGAARKSCRCDVVLNADPQAPDLVHQPCESSTIFLLGSKYALLRREFQDFPMENRETAETAKRVLITMGGGDIHNVTLRVIEALQDVNDLDLDVTVVVGHSNPHRVSLEDAVRRTRHHTTIQTNVEAMPALMSQSDLAITAGGGTCYELAYMGVPMFLITIADNHAQAVEAFARNSAAYSAGWFTSLEEGTLAAGLRHILHDWSLRKKLAANAHSMVDGKGAKRVIETMLSISRQRNGVLA